MKITLAYALMGIIFNQASAFMPKKKIGSPESGLTFSYTNCGPTTDPFIINLLNVQPDPIKLPGKCLMEL